MTISLVLRLVFIVEIIESRGHARNYSTQWTAGNS